MQPSLSYPKNAHLVGQPIVSTQPVAGKAKHKTYRGVDFTRGVSMPANANAAHQLRAMRLRGAGAGRARSSVVTAAREYANVSRTLSAAHAR
ncbi:hypothetical protein D9613_006235 [Agrocybe pediades]|uniref:Uncharacterized protein n=1 Tax=Agrocybe pediades TaxID=84607 RepID=A0A8H4QTL9_9AGAR|nr:hypothetical protein D9613_006235 [Agrocybe pediades]